MGLIKVSELLFEGCTALLRRPGSSLEDAITVGSFRLVKILEVIGTTITSSPPGSSVSILVQVTPPEEVKTDARML